MGEVIKVIVTNARGPRGFSSGALGANSVGAEEIDGSDVAALQEKLGITGAIVTLSANTTLASFDPRPGDAYNLNGKTLTINRMADTRLTNLFRGSGTVIIQSGFARPSWWQSNSYRAAINAVYLGGGGQVELDAVRYPSESTVANPIVASNVTLSGAGTPSFGAGFQTLVGGTILNGPVVFASRDSALNTVGNNVVIQSLGVDSGETVCAANGGVALEGLFFPNIGQIVNMTLREGIIFRDIRVLCRNAAAPVHTILIEKSIGALVENFQTVYGENGPVMKTQKSTVRKGYCRGHQTNFALDKSDVYSVSLDNTWEDIFGGNIVGNDTGPFRIQAATASSAGHALNRVRTTGTSQAVSLEPSGSLVLTDITIDKLTCEAAESGGILAAGNIFRLKISDARITNIASTNPAAAYIGSGMYFGAGMDVVTVSGSQITNVAGDGIRNEGANVIAIGNTVVNPGSAGSPSRFGFNGVAGSMKVPANSNIGTTNGAVTT
jgi:hypothetical protein